MFDVVLACQKNDFAKQVALSFNAAKIFLKE
jgi:hypothetical protein